VFDLLLLAVGSAFYPALLALVLLILTRPRPGRLLLAYYCGALLFSLSAGVALIAFLRRGGVVSGSSGHTTRPVLDLVVGLAALVLLWVILTGRDAALRRLRPRREGSDRPSPASRALGHDSVVVTFFLGMAFSLPGFLYLVALKDIAATDQSRLADVAQLLVFNLVMFAGAELPLLGYLLAPAGTERTLRRVQDWLGRRARPIAAGLCGVAGTLLVTRAIVALL
jgi:hypothetical protein